LIAWPRHSRAAAGQAFWAPRYAELLKSFRKVFVSSEMGLRKPEAAAFAAIAREIGVPVERIMFFDDTHANLEAALGIGMLAVLVRSIYDVKKALGEI
jgi:glucose-1-phosphatase